MTGPAWTELDATGNWIRLGDALVDIDAFCAFRSSVIGGTKFAVYGLPRDEVHFVQLTAPVDVEQAREWVGKLHYGLQKSGVNVKH